MGIETKVTFTSEIFNTEAVHRALGDAVVLTANQFKQSTKDKMTAGPATGRVYARRRGPNFRRSHRASAKGERPAPDTLKLLNSIKDEKTGDTSARVFTDTDYAEILQDKLDRPIMDERDAQEAADLLQRNADAAIARLI